MAQTSGGGAGTLLAVALLWLPAVLAGCTQVDTTEEWQALSRDIEKRTGVVPSWPAVESDAPATGVPLTRRRAIALAIVNSQALQARFEDLATAKADLVQAGLLTNPRIGVTVGLGAGRRERDFAGLVLFPIADLWQIPFRENVARARLKSTTQEILEDVLDIATDAQSAYNAVLFARAALDHAEATRTWLEGRARVFAEHQRDGLTFPHVVAAANAEEVTQQLRVKQARAALRERRQRLLSVLGLPGSADSLVLADEFRLPEDTEFQEAELLRVALASHPTMVLGRRCVEHAERAVALQELRVVRDLDAGLAIAHEGGESTIIGPAVALQFPIFDQNQVQIERAKFLLRRARKRLEHERSELRQDIRQSLATFRSCLEEAAFYRDSVIPLRKRAVASLTIHYDEKRDSAFALLQAGMALSLARRQHLATTLAGLDALVALERTVGYRLETAF